MSKPLPKEITSYDLAKTFAVIFMIIDHAGFYFFPDNDWFRVFGRLCVPVWFFLIGYAGSRDLGPRLWIGMAILMVSDVFAGLYGLPVNILGTMIIVRLAIDPLMRRALRGTSQFWAIQTMLFLLIIPSGMVFEYGTLAIIMATFGYLLRHREQIRENPALNKELFNHFFAFAAVSFIMVQTVRFGFKGHEPFVLGAGILLVMSALYCFKPVTYPRLTEKLPKPLVWMLQLTGRRTLEIYVIHLVMFKITGIITQPHRFVFLDWKPIYRGEDI